MKALATIPLLLCTCASLLLVLGCPTVGDPAAQCDPDKHEGWHLCGPCVDAYGNVECMYCPDGYYCTGCDSYPGCALYPAKAIAHDEHDQAEYGFALPIVVSAESDANGNHWIELDSGLSVDASVIWFSDRDGQLDQEGNYILIELTSGVHTITYEAVVGFDLFGPMLLDSAPLTVVVE